MNNIFLRPKFIFSIYRIVLLLILFIGVGNISKSLYAQPVSLEMKDYNMRAERADSCLLALEKSVLIVRLPTYRKKIDRLEKLERNRKLSAKQRSRAAKQKEQQLNDLDSLKMVIFTGMYDYYDFSDFLITNDTLWDDFLAGKHEGIFYNENQEIDPSIQYRDSTYFVFHYGKTNYEKTNNQTGFIMADADMNDLENPFPYFLKIVNVGKSLGRMFTSELNVYHEPIVLDEFNERLAVEVNRVPLRVTKRERKKKRSEQ